MPSSFSCSGPTSDGAFIIRSRPDVVFGKRDHVPDRRGARRERADPVEPERDPAVRRRAEPEGVE